MQALQAPTERWRKFHAHTEQGRLWLLRRSARFNIVEAPRRSGKTEMAKYSGCLDLMEGGTWDDFLVVFGAPTRDQAKAIFWEDIQRLIPGWMVSYVHESNLELGLVHGPVCRVVGMDQPRRIEGQPIDRGYFDEMAEMKSGTFDRHIRPSMSTPDRLGSGWFFGVPRIGHVKGGGREFKKLADLARDGKHPEFAYHHWGPEGILDPADLATAKDTLDPITYAQEYEARRVSISGRAYRDFSREVHARESIPYNPRAALIFCFDFNVSPGIAVVMQEYRFRDDVRKREDRKEVDDIVSAAIGEVYIDQSSSTPEVCRKLIADWKTHEGPVLCYGDPSGGSRTTKLGDVTDWTEIRDHLKSQFKGGVSIRGPGTEQAQRARIIALNRRIKTVSGRVRLLVDPEKCPRLIEDFEGTVVKPGTDGELWKGPDIPYTHMTDAVGYYCVRAFPIGGHKTTVEQV